MSGVPFEVIVVGGGPIGITAAYALHHAGINFIVMEQRSNLFDDVGASLVLSPHILRVFHQFGILDTLLAIGAPFLHHSEGFGAKTKQFTRSYALRLLEENHGCSLVAFHRAHLIRVLYDGLPESAKARFLTNKKLENIIVTSTGAEVLCTDGSSFRSSIVIGADGAHSKTRSVMRQRALEANSALAATWDPESPYTASYRCVWASFHHASQPGDSYETQDQDRSVVYLTGREKGWIFLYEKLPEPSNERVFYDDKDIRAFTASFAEWSLNGKLKVGDVLQDPSLIAGMANLEEGVINNTSWGGRIVLVGDACHKFTPNAGLGFNNGVQDVVSLCNRLRGLLTSSTIFASDGNLNTAALQSAFEGYQHQRRELLYGDYDRSVHVTRISTWETWLYYILARFILPIGFIQKLHISRSISPAIQRGLVLDYVSAAEPFSGTVPWIHLMKDHSGEPSD